MQIFWGIISATVIFLLREYYLRSMQQKEISTRLFAYVLHWKTKLTQDKGLFNISFIGILWQNKTVDLV